MSPTNISHLLNYLQSAANILNQYLVEITKSVNYTVGTTQVDAFMDTAKGLGHRVEFGHSLDHLPTIFDRFGISGIVDYFGHGMRDAMSPHGMPIPFAKEIRDTLGLRPMTAVDWLSLNIGDVLSGGLSVAHSYQSFGVMRDAVVAGFLPPELAVSIAIGTIVKIGFGISTTNPVSLGAGLFDLGVLAWALYPAMSLGRTYFVEPTRITTATVLTGAVSGAASASGIDETLHANTETGRTVWGESLKRMCFAGGIGAVAGVSAAAISGNPIVISSAAVGGFALGDWMYDQIKNGLPFFHSSEPSSDFLPDFFFEEYLQETRGLLR